MSEGNVSTLDVSGVGGALKVVKLSPPGEGFCCHGILGSGFDLPAEDAKERLAMEEDRLSMSDNMKRLEAPVDSKILNDFSDLSIASGQSGLFIVSVSTILWNDY